MTLRQAGAPDLAALCVLETELFGGDAWSLASISEELARGPAGGAFLVAVEDASCVGYATAAWAGDIADLYRIAVAPPARRRGTGSALLGGLAQRARARGCVRLLLEVSVTNSTARRLYRSAGFAEVSRRRAYYRSGADAVVMSLDLARSGTATMAS